MSREQIKEYTNAKITVVWKRGICIHSENCWRGLVSVFNPKNRPWVNMEGATTEEIIRQVEKCPSGALTWYKKDASKEVGSDRFEASATHPVHIEVVPNGPIRVSGNVDITHSDGRIEKREGLTALCRCGQSSNKPFCDGTHKRVGWQE